MRHVLFLPILLLPLLAQGHEKKTNCLVAHKTVRISGKVTIVSDSELLLRTRTGYVIKLFQPTCYAALFYDASIETVENIQVYADPYDPAPDQIGSLPNSVDDATQRMQLYKYLQAMTGNFVAITGVVDDTSLSGYAFSNPIISVRSIVPCQIAPKVKGIEKCQGD